MAAGQSAEIHLEGACGLSCAPCDCRNSGGGGWEGRLSGGGVRLLVRGATGDLARLQEVLSRARSEGWGRLVVRTHAHALQSRDEARRLQQAGADAILVPLFSARPQVHDLVAGQADSLVKTLVGMRAAAAAGLGIEIEVPLLSAGVQSLTELLELAQRAVPDLEGVRFFVSPEPLPPSIEPQGWDVWGPQLADAIERCRAAEIPVEVTRRDGIPFCALAGRTELLNAFRFKPGGNAHPLPQSTYAAPCEECKARRDCPGLDARTLGRFGEGGIVPFKRKPAELYEQRTTPRRQWTDEQRAAAGRARHLVLRPTVNCNQDCSFCSANESTTNVWTEKQEMLRAIARAGQRGVKLLSLSGGEPTLSPHLASFIHTASRTGIRAVEIVTNGVLLDTPKRVDKLVDAGLTNAFVSLHAHDEATSRAVTQKIGDHERSVKAIHLLLERGVEVAINHVISEFNHRQLVSFIEFLHREFGGRVYLSLAFVTPQFKGLEHLELIPSYADVLPTLRRAMHRAVELGQPFIVGSRQGVPPCLLGEFQSWSDAVVIEGEAASEDQHQKTKPAACADCRWDPVCQGVWKPYAARFGTDELHPIPGGPSELEAIQAFFGDKPFHGTHTFEDLPEVLRDRAAEEEGRRLTHTAPMAPASRIALPMIAAQRSRPLRVAMFGAGRQARRLADAMAPIHELSLDVVVSPHAPDYDLSGFGNCPALDDPREAIDAIRPEGVLITASTDAHLGLARIALEAGVPVLLEKPLGRTEEEGEALVAMVSEHGGTLLPAHQTLFASGLDRVLSRSGGRLSWSRRARSSAPDAPRAWGRSSLFQTLYHAMAVLQHASGGGVPAVGDVRWAGDMRPTLVRASLTWEKASAELLFDFNATVDEAVFESGDLSWKRRGGRHIEVTDGNGTHAIEGSGGDTERMLRHFADVLLGKADAMADALDGLDAFRGTRAVLDALAAAGAPLDLTGGVKHVASKALRTQLR